MVEITQKKGMPATSGVFASRPLLLYVFIWTNCVSCCVVITILMVVSRAFFGESGSMLCDLYASPNNTPAKGSSLDEAVNNHNHNNHAAVSIPRTLMGIFTNETADELQAREAIRSAMRNTRRDDRVCSLHEFRESDTAFRENCKLIYTFVIGVSDYPSMPTERLEDTDTADTPIELLAEAKIKSTQEMNGNDMTHLNIRENQNDGKSQTWFYFANKVAKFFQSHTIDYVMKIESDTMLNFHDFIEFSRTTLPLAPYNNNIFAGSVMFNTNTKEEKRLRRYWEEEHTGIHLYLSGKCYLMATNLAEFVAQEAPMSRKRIEPGGYVRGLEAYDISSMVYHHPMPIRWIMIGKSQQFWEPRSTRKINYKLM